MNRISTFLRRRYTTVSPTQTTLTNYLTTTLNFTLQETLKITSKTNLSLTPNTSQVITTFKNYGLNNAQIKKIISFAPKILSCKAHKTLNPKLKVFQELGLSGSDLVGLIQRNPEVFGFGLNTRIMPGLSLLRKVLGSDENVIEVINKSRWLCFTNYSMKRLETNVAILKDFGLGDDRIVKFILSNPEKVMVNPKVLASKLSYVEERFKISRELPSFIHAVSVALYCSEVEVESKMEVFRGYGWCDSDIALLFRNQPYVLNKSEENIGEKLEFYMKGLGYTPVYLLSCNTFFTFSLKKRVIPRNNMLTILKEKKLVGEKPSLITIVSYTELRFLEYLRGFEDDVPGLCETYLECVESGSSAVLLDAGNVKKRGKVVFYYQKPEITC
ncbi:mitochodrial transcription termination factor [Tanacetum coccineum]|uniref:Mitochodrial transcription termination factor n=1 Tax=Tanacetum coccineum TaxID=301880 RepID=A0ABQ5GCM4_9ASTR